MVIRLILSLAGALLASAPLLTHLRPHSMLRNPGTALISSFCAHALLLLILLTTVRGYGRGFGVTVVAIWVVAFWVTVPNY